MTETAEKQQYTFQAEIARLLTLLSESLYQNREITIRELVSNASDALDKMRYVQLTEDAHRDPADLQVTLEPDKDAGTLTIRDNGIGMTREELVENLGTIAHSGTLKFFEQLAQSGKQSDVSLIGQFGVGFYSAFMLAEKVTVTTRSYQSDDAWIWESDGSGSFTIEAVPSDTAPERGTAILLHLKENLDEFADDTRLKYIVRKYSTFVPHPIALGEEVLNDQRPIWVEPKSNLKDEDYNKFYQHLSHHTEETPLWHLHLSADSPIQFNAILYCPKNSFEKLGFGRAEHGLHLCAKRILVQDNNRDLLPEYLRFLYGLVDSTDLPLNVSREALQDNTIFKRIRKVLVKKVLDQLGKTADSDATEYLKFYDEFGMILREGVATDFENREKLGSLLRFHSSHNTDDVTSLDAYLERAGSSDEKPDLADDENDGAETASKKIYFLGGPDRAAIERNPNLEIFRKRDVEVLYLTDPMDELALAHLGRYKNHDIVSVDSAELPASDKDDDSDKPDDEKNQDDTDAPVGFERVLTLFREALGDSVGEVKRSHRLTDSAACLVNPAGSMSTQMQKMMQQAQRDFPLAKRIFEVNPQAPLITRLAELSTNSTHDMFIRDCGKQLHANALLIEGFTPDTEDTVTRVQRFMTDLATQRSPIIT